MSGENSLSLGELKKQLAAAGLSTATPGLTGDDRFEELQHRWNLHQKVNRSLRPTASSNATGTDSAAGLLDGPAFSHLSIGAAMKFTLIYIRAMLFEHRYVCL